MKHLLLLCFFGLTQSTVAAQDSLSSSYIHHPVVVDSLNIIQNAHALDGFFENLYEQHQHHDRKISIAHIGDSHIQGDYMTTIVRNRLQRTFGNAGRGLIVPCRVAATNEPPNFRTSADGQWTAKRCVYPEQPLPIGVGGITVHTTDRQAAIEFSIVDTSIDHRFNRVTIFHLRHPAAFSVRLRTANNNLVEPITDTLQMGSRFLLPEPVLNSSIALAQNDSLQSDFTLFGLHLENGANGILYHAIGVNGAKFIHYNRAALFADQLALLRPALCIISLGTNESLEYPYLNKSLEYDIDMLIKSIKSKNDHCNILLVTPQENIPKGKRNPGVRAVRDLLLQYAVENGFAFWDWYSVAGGENVSPWKESALLRSDGVHLSKEGYAFQGHLLYHALMKGYEKYVSNRHP